MSDPQTPDGEPVAPSGAAGPADPGLEPPVASDPTVPTDGAGSTGSTGGGDAGARPVEPDEPAGEAQAARRPA